jgi:hypothetical protein
MFLMFLIVLEFRVWEKVFNIWAAYCSWKSWFSGSSVYLMLLMFLMFLMFLIILMSLTLLEFHRRYSYSLIVESRSLTFEFGVHSEFRSPTFDFLGVIAVSVQSNSNFRNFKSLRGLRNFILYSRNFRHFRNFETVRNLLSTIGVMLLPWSLYSRTRTLGTFRLWNSVESDSNLWTVTDFWNYRTRSYGRIRNKKKKQSTEELKYKTEHDGIIEYLHGKR